MPNQTPLNPDALYDSISRAEARAFEFMDKEPDGSFATSGEMFEYAYSSAIQAVREELAVAQPEVTGEQVNLAGWTCDGIHEPGSYATCEDCRGACDDLANFYNNMMQQPKADRPWTGRPEVDDA